MLFRVILYPFVLFWSKPKEAALQFVFALSPLGIEDFVDNLVTFFCQEDFGHTIDSFSHLVRCDRVELALVEHWIDFPVIGQGQPVGERPHDLFNDKWSM